MSTPTTNLNAPAYVYIRVAALSVATWDYIMTLPAEYRFYKSQKSWKPWKWTIGCILFILIRTINIARREPWILWFLPSIFIVVTAGEWFTNLYSKRPIQNELRNCTDSNETHPVTTWLYYVIAICYDCITLCISTYYLLRYYSPSIPSSRVARLVKVMIYDGIGYFVILTGTNVLNLVIFNVANGFTQSSGLSKFRNSTYLDYEPENSFTSSRRVFQSSLPVFPSYLSQTDVAADQHRSTHVITEPFRTAQSVSHAMRSQFVAKRRIDEEFGVTTDRPAQRPRSLNDLIDLSDVNLAVQVQVERSIMVDCDSSTHDHESVEVPRVKWTAELPPSNNVKTNSDEAPS
ncbi:uncharacterized protein FIBRA_00306 [Fibroporia radiculosa]|uniref:DUF6533 domain-containing protein n=1 Tax=Fibroporia radiculosa TaxID=599839 RepID=J7RGV2_9APHY|nr:uncharacterized protein FIBRA_00306 [Fibroporia radiculosa]CCL98312.1 predicted protein [Fibroporia radiculosa]